MFGAFGTTIYGRTPYGRSGTQVTVHNGQISIIATANLTTVGVRGVLASASILGRALLEALGESDRHTNYRAELAVLSSTRKKVDVILVNRGAARVSYDFKRKEEWVYAD